MGPLPADLGIWPYASEDGVHFDWSAPNQEYWDRARRMCQAAVEHGIRPALVLMWCNYVPGTWGAKIAERCGAEVMPREEVRAHVARVVENLGEFDPVYVVTGDTDFAGDEAIVYYEDALDEVVKRAPEALRTMHINRGNRTIPAQYLGRLDFTCSSPATTTRASPRHGVCRRTYRQLSQKADGQLRALLRADGCVAQRLLAFYRAGLPRERMVVDSCRRQCRRDLWRARRLDWQTSRSQGSVLGEGFDMPFRWQECLQFAGVWDFGAIEHVLASLGATAGDDALAVVPAQELLDDAREAIRVARVGDRVSRTCRAPRAQV